MELLLSLLPVTLMLVFFVFLDTFKLIKPAFLLLSIHWGLIANASSFYSNTYIFHFLGIDFPIYASFIAPVVEEILKFAYLILLIKLNKTNFVIDTAIHGFAIGTGFALMENVFYFINNPGSDIALWMIRGFGTSIMHGGATAIAGVLIILFFTSEKKRYELLFIGLLIPIIIHAFYNGFYLDPILNTALMILAIPVLLYFSFSFSENLLRDSMDMELDTESVLLSSLNEGKFAATKAGKYLLTVKDQFSPEVVFDIICFIKLYLELSIKAKGVLLLQESGLPVTKEPATEAKLDEMEYLQKNIGPTGMLAIAPIIKFSRKDIWKLKVLE